jgi:putative phage-type endonuclease
MSERIPIVSREQWLELRRRDITASDVAAICGLSPYKSPLRVFAEKCGEVSDTADTPSMRRGRWLESSVLFAFGEENPDWVIKQPKVYVRDAEARIGATPDAIALTPEGETVIQCKVVSKPIFEAGWQDGAPIGYQLQTLTEAMLWDAPRAVVAAMVIDSYTADLHLFPVERHAGAEARIREAVAKFWADASAGRAPNADYSRDGELLQQLYRPKEHVEPIDLSGSNRLPELLEERDRLSGDSKWAKIRIEEINAELTDTLRGAPVAICGEWKITNKLMHRKEFTVAANSFPVLRVTRAKERKAAA